MIGKARPTPDDTDNDLADYEYVGDSITEDLLENGPKLQGTTEETLTFIHKLIVQFLLEDLLAGEAITDKIRHPSETEDSTRSQMDSLINLFFCNDEYVSKSQEKQAEVDKQIGLWNSLARNTPEQSYEHVVDKIILIISIPASKAICERSCSSQKRTMGHGRVASNRDLLRARFLVEGGSREQRYFLINSIVRGSLNAINNLSE
jgi:hypothetical protein